MIGSRRGSKFRRGEMGRTVGERTSKIDAQSSRKSERGEKESGECEKVLIVTFRHNKDCEENGGSLQSNCTANK